MYHYSKLSQKNWDVIKKPMDERLEFQKQTNKKKNFNSVTCIGSSGS